ncbi:MAG: protein-disulfide reductase DsbD [Pseudomonadota bacterium]
MFRLLFRGHAAPAFLSSVAAARGWRARWHTVARLLLIAMLCSMAAARAEEQFLEPGAAFKFSARMQDSGTLVVTYDIADGYYMYRERFRFTAGDAELGPPQFPPGKVKFDDTFQKNVETYTQSVSITIPVQSTGLFTLYVSSQGCADKGLCYSPQDASARLFGNSATAPKKALPKAPLAAPAGAGAIAAPAAAPVGELGRIEAVLKSGQLALILPGFLLFGLLLSYTPCVLPMVPILSSIIIGEGQVGRARGLLLSATYVLGMALVYTALGVAAGLIGEGLAASLQNPWVLGLFAVVLAVLSLSMFGVYELQVPSALQSKLAGMSNRQRSGKLLGVFVMGAISAVIVGPCVAAPLAGVLLYIGQSRDVLIGGGALFAMAIGMSVPLLLVGVSAGSLLPRAGAWMEQIKRLFGVMLLATAWWLVSPVLPAALQMLGWTALLVGYGMVVLLRSRGWPAKACGLALASLGMVQLVGVASGGRDPLAPLAHLRGTVAQPPVFTRVKTVAELDAALAGAAGKMALLDFYADWCVSCKEMEKLTFVDPAVYAKMSGLLLLQVDVTANTEDDKELLKRFNLFGPPGIILFDAQGKEVDDARVIGYQEPRKFLASLARLK